MPETAEFQLRMQRVEQLVQEIESLADAAARDRAVELATLLMELHAAGLERILELLSQPSSPGDGDARDGHVIDGLAKDPLAASLLLLHGLHPVALETRVRQALDKVRPALQSHGGDVELLAIEDGIVRLRWKGSCSGCPSSAQTLQHSIEEAVYEFAPDVVELRTEEMRADEGGLPRQPVGFVPLAQLG